MLSKRVWALSAVAHLVTVGCGTDKGHDPAANGATLESSAASVTAVAYTTTISGVVYANDATADQTWNGRVYRSVWLGPAGGCASGSVFSNLKVFEGDGTDANYLSTLAPGPTYHIAVVCEA